MEAGLPLMEKVITPLGKSILLPLRLSAGRSAADAAIQKNLCIRNYSVSNPKQRNWRYSENS